MAIPNGNCSAMPTRQGRGTAINTGVSAPYTPIPCNTRPVDNQSGAGYNPDSGGMDSWAPSLGGGMPSLPPAEDYFGG